MTVGKINSKPPSVGGTDAPAEPKPAVDLSKLPPPPAGSPTRPAAPNAFEVRSSGPLVSLDQTFANGPHPGAPGIAGMDVVDASQPATAATAARAEVAISEAPVHAEMAGVVDEAKALREDLQADAAGWFKQAEALADKPGYKVSIREVDGARVLDAARLTPNGEVAECVRLVVASEGTELTETVHTNGAWVSTYRRSTLVEGGTEIRVERNQFNGAPGDTSPLDEGFFDRAEQTEHAQLEISVRDGNVSREEKCWIDSDSKHRKDKIEESKLTFKIYSGGELNLAGGVEKAFHASEPIIERHVHVTEKFKGDRVHNLAFETAYCQGHVRAVEFSEKQKPVVLLEKEIEPGVRRESQLFRHGTQKTVRTTTEVKPDNSVEELKETWDSNGEVVGSSDQPKRINSSKTTRRYDEKGELNFERNIAFDDRTGDINTTLIKR